MLKKNLKSNLNIIYTHTGLELKLQWSTIISGRKSSLKEAIFFNRNPSFLQSVRLKRMSTKLHRNADRLTLKQPLLRSVEQNSSQGVFLNLEKVTSSRKRTPHRDRSDRTQNWNLHEAERQRWDSALCWMTNTGRSTGRWAGTED